MQAWINNLQGELVNLTSFKHFHQYTDMLYIHAYSIRGLFLCINVTNTESYNLIVVTHNLIMFAPSPCFYLKNYQHVYQIKFCSCA